MVKEVKENPQMALAEIELPPTAVKCRHHLKSLEALGDPTVLVTVFYPVNFER